MAAALLIHERSRCLLGHKMRKFYLISCISFQKLTEPSNLMPTIKKILVDHFSDILFLDKVVCQYVPSENGTYFVTSIEEKISLVSYYNCRKDDKKSDIENYMLELAWMIRCHRIFSNLNSAGR